jgi:hypothetical protein
MVSLDANAPVSRRTRASAKLVVEQPLVEQKQLNNAIYRGAFDFLGGDQSDTEAQASGEGHNNGNLP